jgi:ligand-binding SRPBCC domain-containing protein
MKLYHLKRTQFLPITMSEAWSFFSSPHNLARITPSLLRFQILYISGGDKMYSGQIIHYKINALPGVRMNWVTEITHVNEPFYFIDEQRSGPYALWHHQHRFKEASGGVEMIDELNYSIPLGWIGRLAHLVFVGRAVSAIFEHRYKVLAQYFESNKVKTVVPL